MLETLIAVTILVTLASATLIGARTAQSLRTSVDRQSIAENVARNQMEYIFSLPYRPPPTPYPAITSTPDGYLVTTTVGLFAGYASDANFQVITVEVTGAGQSLLKLSTLRANDSQ